MTLPVVLAELGAFLASTAVAHPPDKPVKRGILRIQGYRSAPGAGTAVVGEVILIAQGKEYRFWATDWRRFNLEQEPSNATPNAPQRLHLQADFPLLNQFANARGDQLITILGEQRPQSSDLFVLTMDLCPLQ